MKRVRRALEVLRHRTATLDAYADHFQWTNEAEVTIRRHWYNFIVSRREALQRAAAALSPRYGSPVTRLSDAEVLRVDLNDASSVRELMKKKNEELPRAWVSSKVAAELLGKTTATLAKWRYLGRGPSGWKQTTPTTVMYPLDSVIEYRSEKGLPEWGYE